MSAGAAGVAPGVLCVIAGNAGPYTAEGTNSYLVGDASLVVVDPGPDEAAHVAALLAAAGGRPVTHILLTHRHRDHCGAVAALKAATGALLAAAGTCPPRRRPRGAAEAAMEAAADHALVPDIALAGGGELATPAGRFHVVATPGHAADHLAFALPEAGLVFTGDHVMGWSTSIVAPPDGDMAAYRASLARLAARPERLYLPGHGPAIADGPARVRALADHRSSREAGILAAIAAGAGDSPAIVAAVYPGLDPRLAAAAELSVIAHLEELAAAGRLALTVDADGHGHVTPG